MVLQTATDRMPEKEMAADNGRREDVQSVESIVNEYTPRLRTFISSRVACREDAEDVLQEVFYQLVRSTAGDIGRIECMSAWLFRVANNTILNLWRKRREDELPQAFYDNGYEACEELQDVLFGADSQLPDMVYLRKLVWHELDLALDELPPEQRDVFCLTVFDGMPVKEISRATGVSVFTLLSRKHYAVKFLRKRLGDLYEEIVKG